MVIQRAAPAVAGEWGWQFYMYLTCWPVGCQNQPHRLSVLWLQPVVQPSCCLRSVTATTAAALLEALTVLATVRCGKSSPRLFTSKAAASHPASLLPSTAAVPPAAAFLEALAVLATVRCHKSPRSLFISLAAASHQAALLPSALSRPAALPHSWRPRQCWQQ